MSLDTVLDPHRVVIGDHAVVRNVPGFLHTLQNVLSPEECAAIIEIAEGIGFVPVSLYTDITGKEHFSENRKSARCIVDSHEFVRRLWLRIQHVAPPTWGVTAATCVGLNERLRILRYDPGDEFLPHSDGSYVSPSGAISKLTVLLYLNVGYEGGFTQFVDSTQSAWVPIQPSVGSVAIQDQALVHRVPPVLSGRKYAIRTEVMYQPVYVTGPVKELVIYEDAAAVAAAPEEPKS